MGGCFSSKAKKSSGGGKGSNDKAHLCESQKDDCTFPSEPTEANTLKPHIGPTIVVTDPTPNASNADFTDYMNDTNSKSDDAKSSSETSTVTQGAVAGFIGGDGVHLKMKNSDYITRNGRFLELRPERSEDSEFILINTDHDTYGTCVSIQTRSRELAFDVRGTLEHGMTAGRPITLDVPAESSSQLWQLNTHGEFKVLHTVAEPNLVMEAINEGRLQIMSLRSDDPAQMFTVE